MKKQIEWTFVYAPGYSASVCVYIYHTQDYQQKCRQVSYILLIYLKSSVTQKIFSEMNLISQIKKLHKVYSFFYNTIPECQ